jgi:hypothetical protein
LATAEVDPAEPAARVDEHLRLDAEVVKSNETVGVAPMEAWEALRMSRKEVWRPGLVKALVAGQFTNRQVAGGLHLSVRQVQRLKRRFQTAGVAGLVDVGGGRLAHAA